MHDKEAAYREQKIALLLKGVLPVPQTHYIGEHENTYFAITEFMQGISLRELLLSDIPHDLNNIMHEIGNILSKIASYKFSYAGFLDKKLQVLPHEASDILKYTQECLNNESVSIVLGNETISKIIIVLEKYGFLISNNQEKNLVHGDFDPANILVEKINHTWKVSGILDWEFAFSGSILWDVANMLRYAHKMPPEFQGLFIDALKKNNIKLPNNWQTAVCLLNLSSLLDCLKRSDIKNHPNRRADIRELIENIIGKINI